MNITQFHAEVLNASVKNQQWSWGSENDHAIFLRGWYHQLQGGKVQVQSIQDKPSAGLNERIRHLEACKQGKPGYMVLMQARDPKAEKLSIRQFDQVVYPIIKIATDLEGVTWAHINCLEPVSPRGLR